MVVGMASWALPAPVDIAECSSGSGLGVKGGGLKAVGEEDWGGAAMDGSLTGSCVRTTWDFLVSLGIGGRIGVVDFFGEWIGGGMGVSVVGSLMGATELD